MNSKEYKAMVVDFDKALAEKCKEECIPFQKLSVKGNQHYYQLGMEVYVLVHDGERPRWQYCG